MLRINALKSAKDYYIKSLTKGDYYSEQSETVGQWQGLSANKLGLIGEIQKTQFDNLCDGLDPFTGEQLTSRLVANRRDAYDFTFSVPKSVSILSALSSVQVQTLIQSQIIETTKSTMQEVEKNIQCHVRNNKQNHNRVTGNIVYGYFLHKNSRPIAGYSDPQLHVHAVVSNLTFDRVDNKWKAVEMRDKFENREYYNSIFNSTLANRLQNLGLEIRKTPGDFDLVGITDQTIKTFSRRTSEIEIKAQELGIYYAEDKGNLGAKTRQSKSDKHSQSQLKDIYENLLEPDQKVVIQKLGSRLDSLETIANNLSPINANTSTDQTQKWLDYTLENHFERHSTSSEQRLIGEALKNGIGQTNLKLVTKAIEQYKKDGVLIDELSTGKADLQTIQSRKNLSPSLTTQIALQQEQNIVELVDSNMRIHSPISVRYSNAILEDTFLNPNQKEVVSKIFTNSDGVLILEGKAGTGKTTTLKAIEKGMIQNNFEITILAPTNKAVEVLQQEGFGGAMTVSKYLTESKKDSAQPQTPNKFNQYLIVDEASLVSVRQLNQLLELANTKSQRALLVGDTKQHKSVERGNILKTMQAHSQVRTYSLSSIQRQTTKESKSAVEDLSQGNVESGISKFQKLGFVREIQDDKLRLEALAKLYISNLPEVQKTKIKQQQLEVEIPKQSKNLFERISTNDIFNSKKQYQTQIQLTSEHIDYRKLTPQPSTLVISPTHSDGQDIHQAIRIQLKANNLISSEDHQLSTLRPITWTTAQKGEISNYQPGQILQFTGNIKEFKKGDRFEVVTLENQNQTKGQNQNHNQDILKTDTFMQNTKTGETLNIPYALTSYFEVYKKESITLSNNDLIQLQKQTIVQDTKGKDHKTTNGATYQIKSISPKTGNLTLSNDWIIPSDFGSLKSAYYSTSQASQGQTVQHSIFYTSKASLPLLNQEMVYVANSRFKQTNMILTPDLEQFKQEAQKGEVKGVALSVIKAEKVLPLTVPQTKTGITQTTDQPNFVHELTTESKGLSVEAPKQKMKR
jgi:conjugative relaxase-like TrwC/TraI family protein